MSLGEGCGAPPATCTSHHCLGEFTPPPPVAPLTVAVPPAGIADAGLPAEVEQLFRNVFAGGRQGAAAFMKACPSVATIRDMLWFKEDLHDDAAGMTEVYKAKTQSRRRSEAYQHLAALVHSTTSAQPVRLRLCVSRLLVVACTQILFVRAAAAGTVASLT